MKKLLLLFILIPSVLAAQPGKAGERQAREETDSIIYYNQQIGRLWRTTIDSLRNSDSFKIYTARRDQYVQHSNDYTGFSLFFDIIHTDYGSYNATLQKNGFETMVPQSGRIGFGFSSKHNRFMFDMVLLSLGFNSTSKKGDEEIKTRLSSMLELNFGVDLLKSRSVSIYPYAGIGLRNSVFEYNKPTQTNPAFDDISNIVANRQSAEGETLSVGYQAGLAFEVVVAEPAHRESKTILFIKAGMTRPFKETSYKIEGMRFKPGIRQADWMITVGFKLAGRG